MSDALTLPFTIRPARPEDIPRLEWWGMLTPFREILEKDFARAEKGELLYIVAEANGYPIGQIEVDLTRKAADSVGLIMALRVLPPFERLGIGGRLLNAAEDGMREHELSIAELGVAKENVGAYRLYLRQGYAIVGELTDEWGYTTPEGEHKTVIEEEWVMHKPLIRLSGNETV